MPCTVMSKLVGGVFITWLWLMLPKASLKAVCLPGVVMQALTGKTQTYCCLNTAEMSPPQASGVPPLTIHKNTQLQAFADNCFACHRGNPAKRLNFMAGANEDEVLANIQAKKEIRDALDWERYEGNAVIQFQISNVQLLN